VRRLSASPLAGIHSRRRGGRRLHRWPAIWRWYSIYQECRRLTGVLAGANNRRRSRSRWRPHDDVGVQPAAHRHDLPAVQRHRCAAYFVAGFGMTALTSGDEHMVVAPIRSGSTRIQRRLSQIHRCPDLEPVLSNLSTSCASVTPADAAISTVAVIDLLGIMFPSRFNGGAVTVTP
jgi:hypothetical protein